MTNLEQETHISDGAFQGTAADEYIEVFYSVKNEIRNKLYDLIDRMADNMDFAADELKKADENQSGNIGFGAPAAGLAHQTNNSTPEKVNINEDMLTRCGVEDIKSGTSKAIGDPVNAATGNFIYSKTDITIDGFNPIGFSRFYNSIDNWQGAFGTNWHHNFEIALRKITESHIEITFEDGHVEKFTLNQKGSYSPVPGKYGKLSINENGGYVFQQKGGRKYTFLSSGSLAAIVELSGSCTQIIYENNRISKIQNECGYLLLEYKDNLISKIVDSAGRCIEYSYDSGNLSSFKNTEGDIYSYGYDNKRRFTTVIDPLDKMVITNVYDDKDRTIEQHMGDGTSNSFEYDDIDSATTFTERNGVQIIYKRDSQQRIYETVFINGSEMQTFDDKNHTTSYTDKNGNKYRYEYDENGNIVKEINPLGFSTWFTYNKDNRITSIKTQGESIYNYNYDDKGNLTSTSDPLGRRLNIEYNTKGRPVKILLPDESFYSLEYDTRGNPVSLKDPMGNVTTLVYDALNRVKSVTRPQGNILEFEYTPGGKVKKVTYPDGTFTSVSYNAKGLPVQETDTGGNITKYKYNDAGKLIQSIDPLGRVTEYEYDSMLNICKIIAPDGSITKYVYNDANLVCSIVDEEGYTTSYEYDSKGNVTRFTDPRGNCSAYRYDALDRLIRAEDANKAVTRFEYTCDGKLQKITDALKGVTEYEYNLAGEVTCVKDVLGNRSTFTYNVFGLLESSTDSRGATTKYEYNSNGKVTKVINPDSTNTSFEYDRNGNVTAVIDAKGAKTVYTYDSMDRLRTIINAQGGIRSVEYTKTGNISAIIDENGNKLQYSYDALGRLIEVTDAKGSITKYIYDAAGNLTELHQHMGISAETLDTMYPYEGLELLHQSTGNTLVTRFAYDKRGLLTEEINSANKVTLYSYDKSGNLVSQTDREGFVTQFQYDAVNNMKGITYDDGKAVEYTYDLLGRVTGIKDWLGSNEFSLDPLGRVLKVRDFANRMTEYKWGPGGEKQLVKYPDGNMVFYDYDIMGRLERVRDAQKRVTNYRYDKIGNVIEKVLPNGIKSEYQYDSLSRLVQMSSADINGKTLEDFRYAYDAIGNRTGITRNRYDLEPLEAVKGILGETRYQYDKFNQLVEVISPDMEIEKYFYDTLGNRVRTESWRSGQFFSATNYMYDNQARLIEMASKEKHTYMEYDHRGNLNRTVENGQITGQYIFNAANLLEKAINRQGDVTSFIYDGLGRRMSMQTNTHKQHYVLDITKPYYNVLMVYDKNFAMQRYVHGLDMVSVHTREGGHYYINDELGSPIGLTDQAGSLAARYSYDEFGRPTVLKHPSTPFPFSYTGYQYDASTGLQYAQARYYMPEIGRFISEDSYRGQPEEPQSLNRYTYCHNNPLFFVDPDGNIPVPIITGLLGAGLSLLTTYTGDVISNSIKNGGFSLECLKPSSSIGTYIGNTLGGFIAGATFNPTGIVGIFIFGTTEAAISTGIKYLVDISWDYMKDRKWDTNWLSLNTLNEFTSDLFSNMFGNFLGGLASKGFGGILSKHFDLFKPFKNRSWIRSLWRNKYFDQVTFQVLREKVIREFSDLNKALFESPIDKFVGNILGGIITDNFKKIITSCE